MCVDEETDVEIECRLVAIPEPDIVWHFSGNELQSSENVKINTESDVYMYSTTVKIKKIKKSQEGIYEIIARNREGEASVQIILKVGIEFIVL